MIFVPYFVDGFAAGFPSPADDWQEDRISFDQYVFAHSTSTKFCAKVVGNSMQDAGIHDGDIVVVDKRLAPEDDDIAVCIINGEYTIKRLHLVKSQLFLMPENNSFKPIEVRESENFEVWGVVIHTLKSHRNKKR